MASKNTWNTFTQALRSGVAVLASRATSSRFLRHRCLACRSCEDVDLLDDVGRARRGLRRATSGSRRRALSCWLHLLFLRRCTVCPSDISATVCKVRNGCGVKRGVEQAHAKPLTYSLTRTAMAIHSRTHTLSPCCARASVQLMEMWYLHRSGSATILGDSEVSNLDIRLTSVGRLFEILKAPSVVVGATQTEETEPVAQQPSTGMGPRCIRAKEKRSPRCGKVRQVDFVWQAVRDERAGDSNQCASDATEVAGKWAEFQVGSGGMTYNATSHAKAPAARQPAGASDTFHF